MKSASSREHLTCSVFEGLTAWFSTSVEDNKIISWCWYLGSVDSTINHYRPPMLEGNVFNRGYLFVLSVWGMTIEAFGL